MEDEFNFVAQEIDEGPIEDYFWRSVLTLALYYVGAFIGGFIANIIFLVRSKEEMDAGVKVEARGCLVALLITHIVIVCLLVVVILVLSFIGPGVREVYGDVIALNPGGLL